MHAVFGSSDRVQPLFFGMRRGKCRWSKAVSKLCSPSNAISKAIVGPNSLVGGFSRRSLTKKLGPPGDIVFIRPADSHAFQALGDAPCRIINIMFRPDIVAHLGTRYADEFQYRFFWHAGSSPDAHQIRDPRMNRAINSALELQGSLHTLARIEEFLLDLMTRVADYDAALPNDAPKWLAAACVAARSLSVFRKARPDLWRRQGADMSTHAAKLDTISVCRPLKS